MSVRVRPADVGGGAGRRDGVHGAGPERVPGAARGRVLAQPARVGRGRPGHAPRRLPRAARLQVGYVSLTLQPLFIFILSVE